MKSKWQDIKYTVELLKQSIYITCLLHLYINIFWRKYYLVSLTPVIVEQRVTEHNPKYNKEMFIVVTEN